MYVTVLYPFDRRLLFIVDTSYKEKIGSVGEADEQTRKIAEGKTVHAGHWFIRHSVNDIPATLRYFLGHIYRC